MIRFKRIILTGCALLALAPFAIAGGVSEGGDSGNRDLPQYTQKGWKNVKIVAGGYVPGLIANTKQKGLFYARTDMGGAYRFNPDNKSWIPLTDFIGLEDYGAMGIASLATDPVEPNRLVLACGTYTNDWDKNANMLLSEDYGKSFTRVPMPFKMGGNMPGRGCGERLAIDPNNNKVIYFGSNHAGLWRSEDYGHTWAEVKSFPTRGNVFDYSFAVWCGGGLHFHGIMWVVVDPSSGTPGSTSQNIYAGVADTKFTIYESNDGGASWHPLAGQPDQGQDLTTPAYAGVNGSFEEANPANLPYDTTKYHGHKSEGDTYAGVKAKYCDCHKYYPLKGVYSPSGDLIVLYNANFGPFSSSYQGGAIWKYNIKSKAWTDISLPPHDADPSRVTLGRGVGCVAVDYQNPENLVASTMNEWWPDEILYRSTDGGKSWDPIWYLDGWPNRVDKYHMDISKAPWIDFGAQKALPEESPNIGGMITGMMIDPFDSSRMFYGTGGMIYGIENLKNWDWKRYIDIKVMAEGVEEAAVITLVVPTEGAELLSGMGDLGGFVHWDLNQSPSMITVPYINAVSSIDYAQLKPGFIIRMGVGLMGYSQDYGKTWTATKSVVEGVEKGWIGKVAVSADAKTIVWAGKGKGVSPMWSTDLGTTWNRASGLEEGVMVCSDRVNPLRFYGYKDGKFYESHDGAKSFTLVNESFLGVNPSGNADFKAVIGIEGDIWLAAGKSGLAHSTDGGRTWNLLPGMDEVPVVGLGKAAPGASYQALYISGKLKGQWGIYRSNDMGASWERINDDQHQFGSTNTSITGSPKVYGRVFVATNGRGIQYRDLE